MMPTSNYTAVKLWNTKQSKKRQFKAAMQVRQASCLYIATDLIQDWDLTQVLQKNRGSLSMATARGVPRSNDDFIRPHFYQPNNHVVSFICQLYLFDGSIPIMQVSSTRTKYNSRVPSLRELPRSLAGLVVLVW